MAQRRMFSLAVTDTDVFQDMPTSSQALYFHLGMHGDDDGFVDSPRRIARSAGCNEDDLRVLVTKGFIIPFDSGVVVLRDWRINNTLKNDRYHETLYQKEKALLSVDEVNRYQIGSDLEPTWIQAGSRLEPERNGTKHSLTEQKKEGTDKPTSRPRFSPPGVDDVRDYCRAKGYLIDPERFVDFYASKGWRVGSSPMKDWRAAVRNWAKREKGAGDGKAIISSGENVPAKLPAASDGWFDGV